MKLSTRGRYGLRMLIDLAEHSGEKYSTIARIAERQDISVRYLEQLAVILKRAGFIHSVKGPSGGYSLSRPPEEIIVGDALRSLEGDMSVADSDETEESLIRRVCRVMVYDKLDSFIAGIIDGKTLASLLAETSGSGQYMYFI